MGVVVAPAVVPVVAPVVEPVAAPVAASCAAAPGPVGVVGSPAAPSGLPSTRHGKSFTNVLLPYSFSFNGTRRRRNLFFICWQTLSFRLGCNLFRLLKRN